VEKVEMKCIARREVEQGSIRNRDSYIKPWEREQHMVK
jgi:hypothetical protein